MQIHQPQEIEVWYVIPAIRREIAKEMKELGVSQVKISKILGVTTAAISQYLSDKRAKKVDLPIKIKLDIKNASKRIEKEPNTITSEIQKIIHKIRSSGLLCEYHKKYCQTTKGCTVCMDC